MARRHIAMRERGDAPLIPHTMKTYKAAVRPHQGYKNHGACAPHTLAGLGGAGLRPGCVLPSDNPLIIFIYIFNPGGPHQGYKNHGVCAPPRTGRAWGRLGALRSVQAAYRPPTTTDAFSNPGGPRQGRNIVLTRVAGQHLVLSVPHAPALPAFAGRQPWGLSGQAWELAFRAAVSALRALRAALGAVRVAFGAAGEFQEITPGSSQALKILQTLQL